jgi:hypothetical protein
MLMPANNPLPLPIEAERVTDAPVHVPKGPSFELIEETTWEELKRTGRRQPFDKPVLVKGGIHHWPAWKKWSFEFLADVCAGKGSEVPVKFTDGLVEQGVTKGRPSFRSSPTCANSARRRCARRTPWPACCPGRCGTATNPASGFT